MNARQFLPSSLLVLALACSGGIEETDVIFDGTSTAGLASVGDDSMQFELSGDALSVSGQNGTNAVFSLRVDDGAAAGSVAVRFRLRGSHNVRFSVTTPGVTPTDRGGSCATNCYDTHGASLGVSTDWQTVTLAWTQLSQEGWGTPAGLDPSGISYLNWHLLTTGPYNIWIDEVEFLKETDSTTTPIVGDGDGDVGTGGSVGDGDGDMGTGGAATGGTVGSGGSVNMSENRLGKYVDEIMFLQAFPGKSPAYKYSQLLAAVDFFPEFASCCSEDAKKRDVAAFLAHATHEADYLNAVEEYTPPSIYCDGNPTYPCTPGKSYHGRGAMQLSWNYNYRFAQDYLAGRGKSYNLVATPEIVAQTEELLWLTALWFWMEGDPSYVNDSPHDRLVKWDFAATTKKINGGIECPGGTGSQPQQQRVQYYKEWCARLGISPGEDSTLYCTNATP